MGVVPGDDVTLDTSGAIGTFESAGPGMDIPVTISGLVIAGADSGNYILIQPMTTANIT
jgi:trimeric autotransporter adhesin